MIFPIRLAVRDKAVKIRRPITLVVRAGRRNIHTPQVPTVFRLLPDVVETSEIHVAAGVMDL
jgi:hypothetical protein